MSGGKSLYTRVLTWTAKLQPTSRPPYLLHSSFIVNKDGGPHGKLREYNFISLSKLTQHWTISWSTQDRPLAAQSNQQKHLGTGRGSFDGTIDIALTRWRHADFCVGNLRRRKHGFGYHHWRRDDHVRFSREPPSRGFAVVRAEQLRKYLHSQEVEIKSWFACRKGIFTSPA